MTDMDVEHLPEPLRQRIEAYAQQTNDREARHVASDILQEAIFELPEPEGGEKLRLKVAIFRYVERSFLGGESDSTEQTQDRVETLHRILDEANFDTLHLPDVVERVRGVVHEFEALQDHHEGVHEIASNATKKIGEIRKILGFDEGVALVEAVEELAEVLGVAPDGDEDAIEKAQFVWDVVGKLSGDSEEPDQAGDVEGPDPTFDDEEPDEEGASDNEPIDDSDITPAGWYTAAQLAELIDESPQYVGMMAGQRAAGHDPDGPVIERREADIDGEDYVYRVVDEAPEPEPNDDSNGEEDWKRAGELGDELGVSAAMVSLHARKYDEGKAANWPIERKAVGDDGPPGVEFLYRLADNFDPAGGSADQAETGAVFIVGDEVPGGVIPQHTTDSRESAERYANGTEYSGETCEPAILRVDGDGLEHGERVKWETIDATDGMEVVQ